MIYFIEGARNVGKTFLINKLKELNMETYKFPFKDVYTKYIQISPETNLNDDSELFYTTLGYSITILDLMRQGQIKHDIIIDRGVLSDLIFGIQSGRIDKKIAIEWWSHLFEYEDLFKTVYIYSDNNKDNRNKDEWSFYDIDKTHKIYLSFMEEIDYKPIMFKNEYNEESVNYFINLF